MFDTDQLNYHVFFDGYYYGSFCYYEAAFASLNSMVLKDILSNSIHDIYKIFKNDECIYSVSSSHIMKRLSRLLD